MKRAFTAHVHYRLKLRLAEKKIFIVECEGHYSLHVTNPCSFAKDIRLSFAHVYVLIEQVISV